MQLVVAGLLIVSGVTVAGHALNAAAAWWMIYAAVVDLGTLGVICWSVRRQGISYRSRLGPPAATWQVALGAPARSASGGDSAGSGLRYRDQQGFYGDATLPMFAVVDVPAWASVFGVLVVPVLTELAEPVAYLGILLPWLERRIGRSWLAAPAVVVIWAAEHAFAPLLIEDGGIDLVFAGDRVVSVLPFLAVWIALYYAFGRRLLPVMVQGESSTAARLLLWPSTWSDEDDMKNRRWNVWRRKWDRA